VLKVLEVMPVLRVLVLEVPFQVLVLKVLR